MEKTVLIELTAKKIKLAELIVLMCLFGSIAAGLGLMYLWLPLGIMMFCIAGIAFLAFCRHDYFLSIPKDLLQVVVADARTFDARIVAD